ncbi:MAG: peptidylprolyl isomerase [Burkholderiales bacterium]|nr:peptidylprolyl isomerase [Burkholderiales bacterium]
MQEIQTPCVASLTWTLHDAQGELIDVLEEATEFLVGGDDLLAKVEEALIGQPLGAEVPIALQPEEAFGDYRPELTCFEARALFPPQLEVGMRFEGLPEGAATPDMPKDVIYTVTEIYPEHVVLDGNHPLAGIGLRMHVQVRALREATPEEIAARSVGNGLVDVLESGSAPPDATLH